MPGAAAKSGLFRCTEPRLSGRRLQTLAVIAGKEWTGSPNLSSDTGWTWYSRSGVSLSGPGLVKIPSWLGAIDIGPERFSAYSSPIEALPIRLDAFSLSVGTPVTL